MSEKKKNALSVLLILAVFLGIFLLITRLVMPKYSEHLVEGGMLSQYYREAGGHDVIFVGDCEVYANLNPLVFFEEQGISSYVRGTSQQLLWQSYYVIEETLSYETPQVIVLNVNAMRYPDPVKEEYNRLTLDYMKWSSSKVGMIRASMTEEEDFLSYVFPILRYHSRIFELTGEDLTYWFARRDNTLNGHLVNTDVVPVGTLPAVKKLPDYRFGDSCYSYLDRITALCAEKGIQLVLMKAPSLYPHWYEEYDEQIETYAAEHGIRYINFLDHSDEIGLDFTTDTYDAGIHLNENGAVKLSSFFAAWMKEEFSLPDRRNEEESREKYAIMRQNYEKMLDEQKASE